MSKLPHIGNSIFTVMSQLSNKHNAINLAQGFPNFPVDKKLTDIISRIADNDIHQYTPMSGYEPLLKKIEELIQNNYRRAIDYKSEILVSSGATEAIFATIQALVNQNQEVIILDPSYDCYEAPVLLINAKPIRVALNDDYTPNWEKIEAAINKNTKMIIINNPHNPTGKIWTENDFIQLEKILNIHPEVLILSDEVYEFITFDRNHISIHERENIRNRSIVISSFGKSLHITGWKIGYAVAPDYLMNEIKKIHQFIVFSVNSISQIAISEYLSLVDFKAIAKMYQQKRDLFRNLMKETKFHLLPCEGSYFQVASFAEISNKSDLDFTLELVKVYGVAGIPISPFYENGKDLKLIRFCFAKDDQTLKMAAERLNKF